jgi:4-hydroxy-2-oxoheptanedioate aldolase
VVVQLAESGSQFKADLAAGKPKFGIFVNSHSPTVAEQFAHAGYDWLLVDCQHGPMNAVTMSAMLCAIQNGGAKSMVRVAGYDDRNGIQQALDLGADGILIPYINNAEEAAAGVSCCLYPFGKAGTRSVYFPQRSMNKQGLLGYAGGSNDNVLIALQVETADCIKNMEAICAVPRVDLLFLGQNDLCVSMGLFDGKYEFPAMYTSPELQAATDKLITCANKKNILLGMFQFGTDRVTEFLDKGFNFISVGNDLHHLLTQNFAHKEALVDCAMASSKSHDWTPRFCAMPFGNGGHNPSPPTAPLPFRPALSGPAQPVASAVPDLRSWSETASAAGFQPPSRALMNAAGDVLVGRRIWVHDLGPGTVALFTKNWFFGASSHTVHFDEAGVMEIKLARKTNTDPAKRAWMILAPS